MKTKLENTTLTVMAALLLAGCERQEQCELSVPGSEIRLRAGMDMVAVSGTRSALQSHLTADGLCFTSNQHIALFVTECESSGEEVLNDIYTGSLHTMHTVDGNDADDADMAYNLAFDAGSQCYWPGSYNVNFYAWHPYIENGAFSGKLSTETTTFSVLADQSTPQALTNSDLMAARSTNVASTNNAVPLAFSHKLSKVLVILQSSDNQITAEQLSSATVSLQQGTADKPFYLDTTVDIDAATATINTSGTTAAAIQMGTGSTTMCVLPPGQSLQGKKVVFNMGLDGGANDYTIQLSDNMEPGKVYTITLTLTLTHVEMKSTVTDWTDGRTWDKTGETLYI